MMFLCKEEVEHYLLTKQFGVQLLLADVTAKILYYTFAPYQVEAIHYQFVEDVNRPVMLCLYSTVSLKMLPRLNTLYIPSMRITMSKAVVSTKVAIETPYQRQPYNIYFLFAELATLSLNNIVRRILNTVNEDFRHTGITMTLS